MKILVLGSGGREHALAWACSRSPLTTELVCLSGNGGTAVIARNVPLALDDLDRVTAFAEEEKFDLVLVGPEAPLVDGISDRLIEKGIAVFGPSSAAAKLEGSKVFSKKLMRATGVPTAEFDTFIDKMTADTYVRCKGAPIVVKASGLAAGKGVIVCNTEEQAIATIEAMLQRDAYGCAGREIVIEECLTGRELSLMALVNGEDFLLLPPSRDYKRAFDGDKGPNTGGMGAYAPVDDVSPTEIGDIAKVVFKPILRKLVELGTPYQGCLFAGLIMTDQGVKVLEFNCRLGDPEAQVILPLLKFDPVEMMAATANGKLKDWILQREVDPLNWQSVATGRYAATVVAAMVGYPDQYKKYVAITSLPIETNDILPFHAGTAMKKDGIITNGGRVAAVTGLGASLTEAVERAYSAVAQFKFEGVRYRKDIGSQPK